MTNYKNFWIALGLFTLAACGAPPAPNEGQNVGRLVEEEDPGALAAAPPAPPPPPKEQETSAPPAGLPIIPDRVELPPATVPTTTTQTATATVPVPTSTTEAPLPAGEEGARQHVAASATDVYLNLVAGQRYDQTVNYGSSSSSINLLVLHPPGTYDTTSNADTMMCTDFVIYSYAEAGYPLNEAGLAIRVTGSMESAFKKAANGINIFYGEQDGSEPPRVGDVVFMPGHVALITSINGNDIEMSQFNSRHTYAGKIEQRGGNYHFGSSVFPNITGWGFYFKP